MKTILTLALTGVSAALLAACSTPIPDCQNQDMDKCGKGTVYSEERTATGSPRVAPPAPIPAPVAVPPPVAPVAQPAPAPEPIPAPAPAPADTTIMQQAPEPDLTK